MSTALHLYRRLADKPLGRWLFSRMLCFRAPYFATIRPHVLVLEPGRCVASMRERRAVRNHIGSVHAIALCNLAELVGGMMTDATVPASMRWIPKGMTVSYLKKAKGQLTATATPDRAVSESAQGYELPVTVDIRDAAEQPVMQARIMMWLSPKTM